MQYFYPNFPLILVKLSRKTSLLVRPEILGLLPKTLKADRMYSRQRWDKLPHQVQTLLSAKGRTYSTIFIAFLEDTKNFASFEKKD